MGEAARSPPVSEYAELILGETLVPRLGSHVTSALVPYTIAAEHLKSGKLRVLSAVSRQRIELLPDVPAIAEFGYKDIEADFWIALVAPTRMP
jgi:tripartite-type tricarboxylate transporter receptor subunit TctC